MAHSISTASERSWAAAPDDPLFGSYAQLAAGLLDKLSGVCLLDGQRRVRGVRGDLAPAVVLKRLDELNWSGTGIRQPSLNCATAGQWLTVIPLEQSDGTLLGAFCVQEAMPYGPDQLNRHAEKVAQRLKPLLDCVHRELAAAVPARERIQTLTEQTAELEWLFRVSNPVKDASHGGHPVEDLLRAATLRLGCAMGVIEIPEKRIRVQHVAEAGMQDGVWGRPETLNAVWQQTRQSLLNWAQRQEAPLVVNSAGRNGDKIPRCKIISVRVARDAKRVIGYLAFYNPPFAEDFLARHVYLARHLGRQAAGVVGSQFDLMTGLYTRDGLLQACAGQPGASDAAGCVIYIDLDHMQAVNEAHGFELGNELIVRVADLLSRPLLPETAVCGRLSGDRFAIVIPDVEARGGVAIAEALRTSAKRLHFGPPERHADISLSCGVADLVREPDGLDRSITIAEIACKSAKRHGRDRVEVYACDDQSLIQRNDDAAAVGRLRAALQSERLLLRAQRARRLGHPDRAGGYEIEMQMVEEGGHPASPAPLLEAAQRYQLMPSIDRWVVKNVLRMLAGYRNLLQSSGVWIAVKLSTQSLADPAFIEFLDEELKSARLPPGCLFLTFGEQAAATRLPQLSAMVQRLKAHGCQFGLDGFGIGTHTLGCIKSLQISRVKICSEFVVDVSTNPNSKAAVRAIVELAGGLSIETLAEAVVDEAAARLLQELRVDLAQGGVCGAPEPLQDVLRALAADESQRLHRLYLDQ